MNTFVVWSRDGSEIFSPRRSKAVGRLSFAVDDSSEPEMLAQGSPDQIPLAWSPDGRFLLWEDAYRDDKHTFLVRCRR